MLKILAAAAGVSIALATPASALTVLLGGTATTASSVTRSADGIDFTITAARFTGDPATLSNFSQLTSNLQVRVTTPGVGVFGGGSNEQVDTNQANRREALVISASRPLELSALKLSYIDNNDTLMLYGVGELGVLTPLLFGGTIQTGLAGAASFVNTGANSGTTALTFLNPFGNFQSYVFTTRVGGDVLYNGDRGQGYRIDSISANIVPEPRIWALLIAGFGLVGVAARRRTAAAQV